MDFDYCFIALISRFDLIKLPRNPIIHLFLIRWNYFCIIILLILGEQLHDLGWLINSAQKMLENYL